LCAEPSDEFAPSHWPLMRKVNMFERGGSPISAPTFAMLGPVGIMALYHVNPADASVISEALLPRTAPPWPHGQTLAGEAQYVGRAILWVACPCCRLRAGHLRLGPRLLRPSSLPAYCAGGPGLVAGAGFGRGNNSFLVWRLGGRQSAEALQEIRRLRCH